MHVVALQSSPFAIAPSVREGSRVQLEFQGKLCTGVVLKLPKETLPLYAVRCDDDNDGLLVYATRVKLLDEAPTPVPVPMTPPVELVAEGSAIATGVRLASSRSREALAATMPIAVDEIEQLVHALQQGAAKADIDSRSDKFPEALEKPSATPELVVPTFSARPSQVNGVLPSGVTVEHLRESMALHQELESSVLERREEERRLHTELEEVTRESDALTARLSQVISKESHESIVEQLQASYEQSIVTQEERLVVQEQQIQQARGDRVVEMESEVCNRERQLVFARRRVQEAQTAEHLADLEKRRCEFLERHLDEQHGIWPALQSKQDELDHYRQVIGIYNDELRAATELADVLRTEGNAWRERVTSESASAGRQPQRVAQSLKVSGSAPRLLSPSQPYKRLPPEATLPTTAFPAPWLQAQHVPAPPLPASREHRAYLRPV